LRFPYRVTLDFCLDRNILRPYIPRLSRDQYR
jgi:hypothetical protein